ncbi:exo-beta-1,3-glucanase [Lentinula edodes]|uniref:exo-beta-1,3-glucanase n=1 Tax=Lentinula edodes TaxID=5353 RepID=UPI001E8D8F15|nr:exo-beta-1,3-glucanase [Lentinula edodes]KAH7869703.1 exo-beta-1,3-glucanase [Lentinula edodes]
MVPTLLLWLSLSLSCPTLVQSLGTSCSAPLTTGTAAASDPYWLESITHQGTAAYNADPTSYQVFRNVMDFGAKGDGVTDDTAAINSAISSGDRCGLGSCNSSTVTPAVVFFPSGTYLISTPLNLYYYTQLIGDAKNPPTLLASAAFAGMAVINADIYLAGGSEWYAPTNNLNFVIDLTQVPAANSEGTGIHWQVSQGTSLMNIVFEMSTESDTAHQGYTFQGVTINNCQVGFDLATGGITEATQSVGGEAIIDAVVIDTPIFVRTSAASTSLAGSIVINNAQLTNVGIAVGVLDGETVLEGSTGSLTIDSWGQGNVYFGTSTTGTFTQGEIVSATKPSSLLDSAGRIVGKMHPQYADYAVDQFVSVKSKGAKGDGATDDTATLQAIFDAYSGCAIIFFDAGTYIVTSTLQIPAGTQMVGEAWSVIAGSGSAFEDQSNPQVVVQVGAENSQGIMEISDIIFTTVGPTPGAIVVEWNVQEPSGNSAGAGMWDSHIRLGGAIGTNLETNCPADGSGGTTDCFAAYMALHLTASSSAYLEAEHHSLYQLQLDNAQNHYLGLFQTEIPYYQPSPESPSPFTSSTTYNDPTTFDSGFAWAVNVVSSTDIIFFGAGLYSFYNDYTQDCLDTMSCQPQLVNIDSTSSVTIYSLSTIGATYQLSVENTGIVNQSDNIDGYQSTVTVWSSS